MYYYPSGVKQFDELMKAISDLDELDNGESWMQWHASDREDIIYGKTKTFSLSEIEKMSSPYREKMNFIYKTIMDSFYDVCKDYAKDKNDTDEPNLFPAFNIKKYDTGVGMGAHFDQLDGDKTLRYSLVMYLNDDFEGGEISFVLADYERILEKQDIDFDYDLAVEKNEIDFGIKPKAGSIIIFPSSAPYHHTAHTVKSGFKYMVPGHWIHNNLSVYQGM